MQPLDKMHGSKGDDLKTSLLPKNALWQISGKQWLHKQGEKAYPSCFPAFSLLFEPISERQIYLEEKKKKTIAEKANFEQNDYFYVVFSFPCTSLFNSLMHKQQIHRRVLG